MLTRLEETLPAPLDEHDRFPARSSVAHKQGFLDRPLIDEYTEIFWAAIKKIWPGLKRSRKQFRVDPSHDVDSPSYYAFRPWRKVLRRAAGDLVKRGQFYVAAKDLFIKIRSATRLHPADPYNTFSWIMDTSEQADLTSTFYFMSGQTNPQFDGDYDLAHPAIRQLIREVRDRGHRVGLHPSYECYRRSDSMLTEANRLREMCIEEQFSVTGLPARMHYLRWETPTTAAKLERAGVTRDCTLTFADHAGFRCGTCHDYQAFDPVRRRSMKIRIQPLIAMETTVLDNRYMGHGVSADAADQFLSLKAACRTVDGVFTLLWHNTQLTSAAQRALYTAVIAG
jgi:hypothetical protein